MPAIQTDGLTRGFRHGLAVDGVSFSLPTGAVLALLGPNGAGKTTTVRLLNGVLAPDAGRALVLGMDPTVDGEAIRRRTGVVTENAGLDDRLTCRENLEYVARLRGFGPEATRRRVGDLLERFGMADRGDDLTGGFSTGQRKRVALARALLHDPEVLFLDEPTSGLDPAGTRSVVELITDLAGEGRTVVLATHFLGEAGRLADHVAVLHRGRLRAYGTPSGLAAGLWQGVGARLDLGGPVPAADQEALAAVRGVQAVLDDPAGVGTRPRRPGGHAGGGRHGRGPRAGGEGGRGAPAHPRGRLLRHRAPHRRGGRRGRHRRLRPAHRVRQPGDGAVRPVDVGAVRTIVGRDLRAVRRSKAIMIPMIVVPALLLVMLPASIGLLARAAPSAQVANALSSPIVQRLAGDITGLPEREQLVVLVLGYLLSPLILVIPLMVSAVVAADAFAGEKERRTLEVVLHLPISDRDLFLAKVLTAMIPAVTLTWVGAVVYSVVANVVAWPVLQRVFLPFTQFGVMVLFVGPGVALLALGLLVIVSSRARTAQEANQLGGAVILPLIFLAAAQASTLLLLPAVGVAGAGVVVWALALGLLWVNGRRFTRDRLASST